MTSMDDDAANSTFYDDDLYDDFWVDDDWIAPAEYQTTYILMRIMAGLSFLASLGLFVETVAEQRKRPNAPAITRLLTVLSVAIMIHNICYMLGITMSPKQVGNAPGAHGSILTCDIQGFFVMFSVQLLAFYDSTLSVSYVLLIRFGWTDKSIKKFHWVIHGIVPVASVIVASLGWYHETYNFDFGVCFATSYPEGCGTDDWPCKRGGSNYLFYRYYVFSITIFALLCSSVSMAVIFLHMRTLERRNQRYSIGSSSRQSSLGRTRSSLTRSSSSSTRRIRTSRRFAIQGLLYTSTFFITYMPNTIHSIIFLASQKWSDPFMVITDALLTMNGIFYFLFYLREHKKPLTWYGRVMRRAYCCLDLRKFCEWCSQRGKASSDSEASGTVTPFSSDGAMGKGDKKTNEADVEEGAGTPVAYNTKDETPHVNTQDPCIVVEEVVNRPETALIAPLGAAGAIKKKSIGTEEEEEEQPGTIFSSTKDSHSEQNGDIVAEVANPPEMLLTPLDESRGTMPEKGSIITNEHHEDEQPGAIVLSSNTNNQGYDGRKAGAVAEAHPPAETLLTPLDASDDTMPEKGSIITNEANPPEIPVAPSVTTSDAITKEDANGEERRAHSILSSAMDQSSANAAKPPVQEMKRPI